MQENNTMQANKSKYLEEQVDFSTSH